MNLINLERFFIVHIHAPPRAINQGGSMLFDAQLRRELRECQKLRSLTSIYQKLRGGFRRLISKLLHFRARELDQGFDCHRVELEFAAGGRE